jgi:hypothetical protein
MNRDDIIRMAREAGIQAEPGNSFADDMYFAVLYRFAALVAASEREACAKVCADGIKAHHYPMLSEVAAAIRARGKQND